MLCGLGYIIKITHWFPFECEGCITDLAGTPLYFKRNLAAWNKTEFLWSLALLAVGQDFIWTGTTSTCTFSSWTLCFNNNKDILIEQLLIEKL